MAAKETGNILLLGDKFTREGNIIQAIRREGWESDHTADAMQGVSLFAKAPYDIVFIGCTSKGLIPVESLTLLRNEVPDPKNLYILMSVPEEDKEEIPGMKDLGANKVLSWPNTLQVLRLFNDHFKSIGKNKGLI